MKKLIALERESPRSAAWNVSGMLIFRGDDAPDFGGIRCVNHLRFIEEFTGQDSSEPAK